MLYVSERCFESGGLIWDNIFDQLCWCLFILEFFTGGFATVILWSTC